MDPNWIRWIVASLNKHFKNSITIPVYLENENRRTDPLEDYAEFRWSGPRFSEQSKDYWYIEVDIDVLVFSKGTGRNGYTPEVGIGSVLAAFTADIPVFQLPDPNLQLGCLRKEQDIIVTNFGLPKDQGRLRMASVEATYCMNLST